MPKYFLNGGAVRQGGMIYAKGESVHHMLRVLRFKPGESVIFCDGNGTDFRCVYDGLENKKETMRFIIREEEPVYNELPYSVTLYQSVIAAGKMDLAIQKCVELGVSRIVPVYTKYSSVKQTGTGIKNERFQRIAENAAEQSMRGTIPEVAPPVRFEDAIAEGTVKPEDDLWLAAYENEKTATISKIIGASGKPARPVSFGVWIGPEGGFAGDEIAALERAGAKTVTLGRRILRAETAGPAVLAQLQCALGAEAL